MKPLSAFTLLPLALLLFTSPCRAAVPGGEALGGLISGQFDTNKDGEIDSGEWQSGIAGGFDHLDANDNDILTSGEIDQLNDPIREQFGEFGAILVVTLVKAIVLTFDTNKDRSVTKAEYDAGTRKALAMVDADKNGKVSNSELVKLPEKLLGSE